MDDFLKRTMQRNLLKYAAGAAIFCPLCEAVADCKRWVIATYKGKTCGVCAKCWDKHTAGKVVSPEIEVTDGRVVFARAKRAPGLDKRKIVSTPEDESHRAFRHERGQSEAGSAVREHLGIK